MANPLKYQIVLTPQQRETLERISRNGSGPAKKILRARILLMSDAHHPEGRYHDEEIARVLFVHAHTVSRVRKAFVVRGWHPALERKKRQVGPTPPKLDGHGEAMLVAICCSPAPAGRVRWTLNLLQQELVNRQIVTSIARETVRTTLKKTGCSHGGSSGSASPSRTRPASSRKWNRCWTSTHSRPMRRNHW
jgi:transposase